MFGIPVHSDSEVRGGCQRSDVILTTDEEKHAKIGSINNYQLTIINEQSFNSWGDRTDR